MPGASSRRPGGIAPVVPRAHLIMVHNMDAMSSKWRDDPVRAALDKKKNREAAAERMAKANALASEILKKRMEAGSKVQHEGEEESGGDADYRLLLERQRNRLMEGNDSDSSSSNLSVFDPFQSRRDRKEEKRERKEKKDKKEKKKSSKHEGKHTKKKHKSKDKKHKDKDKHRDKDKSLKERRARRDAHESDKSDSYEEVEKQHEHSKKRARTGEHDDRSRTIVEEGHDCGGVSNAIGGKRLD